MSKSVIVALDQGTTSSRAILFDKQGRIVSSAQKEFTQFFPKPGFVEHDPMEIWSSQISVTAEALSKVNLTADQSLGIALFIGVQPRGKTAVSVEDQAQFIPSTSAMAPAALSQDPRGDEDAEAA